MYSIWITLPDGKLAVWPESLMFKGDALELAAKIASRPGARMAQVYKVNGRRVFTCFDKR
jgi:hypothetical protein